jgi:dihydroxy-acid dehydratase
MLYGIGLTENDLKESSSWNCKHGLRGKLCNMHLNDLAKDIKQGFGKKI